MIDKVQKIREEVKTVVNRRLNLLNGDYFDLNKETDGFTNEIIDIINSLQEEPVSEDLEEAAEGYGIRQGVELKPFAIKFFKAGAKWQKENLWKSADGDDLPDIDREVIALLDNGKVVFAHRPPEYWDGKNIITGKVTRNYPKTYDKGGWNIPDIVYWLDVNLPKEIEL